mgnify:CR=1 FL=1
MLNGHLDLYRIDGCSVMPLKWVGEGYAYQLRRKIMGFGILGCAVCPPSQDRATVVLPFLNLTTTKKMILTDRALPLDLGGHAEVFENC